MPPALLVTLGFPLLTDGKYGVHTKNALRRAVDEYGRVWTKADLEANSLDLSDQVDDTADIDASDFDAGDCTSCLEAFVGFGNIIELMAPTPGDSTKATFSSGVAMRITLKGNQIRI